METVDEMTERVITAEAKKRMDVLFEKISAQYILVDTSTLKKQLCMSDSFFEKNIATDLRIKLIQHRRTDGRTIFYKPDEVKQVIYQIINEWEG